MRPHHFHSRAALDTHLCTKSHQDLSAPGHYSGGGECNDQGGHLHRLLILDIARTRHAHGLEVIPWDRLLQTELCVVGAHFIFVY